MDWLILLGLVVLPGLLLPVFLVLIVLVWGYVGLVVEAIIDWVRPPDGAHCDIDPRCHSAFFLDADGSGWIGGVKVVPRGT